MRKGRLFIVITVVLVALTGIATCWLFQEVDYLRIDSPDGRYKAIVTYRKLESLRPTFPGQSGDKAGFIRIEDKDGRSFGKAGIPMVWMARDLEWTESGASLKLVCEWDFAKREYRFWNEVQTEETVRKAR